jgi:hypothetical protein
MWFFKANEKILIKFVECSCKVQTNFMNVYGFKQTLNVSVNPPIHMCVSENA